VFSDAAIQFCLTIKVLFKLPLRQTTGMVASLLNGVVSRMWWKFSGGDLGALGFGPDQATRSRVIGSMG
jgi:hypothetical protein